MATFRMLNRHMWPVARISASTGVERFYCHRTFYRRASTTPDEDRACRQRPVSPRAPRARSVGIAGHVTSASPLIQKQDAGQGLRGGGQSRLG